MKTVLDSPLHSPPFRNPPTFPPGPEGRAQPYSDSSTTTSSLLHTYVQFMGFLFIRNRWVYLLVSKEFGKEGDWREGVWWKRTAWYTSLCWAPCSLCFGTMPFLLRWNLCFICTYECTVCFKRDSNITESVDEVVSKLQCTENRGWTLNSLPSQKSSINPDLDLWEDSTCIKRNVHVLAGVDIYWKGLTGPETANFYALQVW